MKLHVVEPDCLRDCIVQIVEEHCCKIPLFRGRRLYALRTTEEEQNCFYRACDHVIRVTKEVV